MAETPLVIWDWNGTLLDDVAACIEAMNVMLEKRNLPSLTPERYRNVFTFPVIDYYHAVGFDFNREPFAVLAEEYIRLYRDKARTAPLRPGAVECLGRLARAGCRQIILSATETGSLERQVSSRGVRNYFTDLIGADNIHAHGKIDVGRAFVRNLPDVTPSDAILVGDTFHDYEVSRALGCRCVLLRQGHQRLERFHFPADTIILDELSDLPSFGWT